jgi:hypothetical protein
MKALPSTARLTPRRRGNFAGMDGRSLSSRLRAGAARRLGCDGVGSVGLEVLGRTRIYRPRHHDWGFF